MTIDLAPLKNVQRVLFEIPLAPIQGHRFQPTGFPGLGAATFQTANGTCLLVESAQSMANRLELTCWDQAKQDLKADLAGLSHVRVMRNGGFLTDSILEPHRLNSPYIEKSTPAVEKEKHIHDRISDGVFEGNSPLLDRNRLAATLLRYDIGSLVHGVFLESIDGRIRLSRSLSAFIEADGVRVAASGGVKNDHVNPSGATKEGFGNVPFSRDEFTAELITLYASLDLAQIRGYGLDNGTTAEKALSKVKSIQDGSVERLLILLCLYKLRAVIDGGLRLRTACDLRVTDKATMATLPEGFLLPALADITKEIKPAIEACKELMDVTVVNFNAELKKGKEQKDDGSAVADDSN